MNNTSKIIIISILGILLVILTLFTVTVLIVFDDWETRASFGDMFGAVNALFSALALVGIVYTIIIQSNELTLQREELKLTRQELGRTAIAQEQAAKLDALNHLINGYNLRINNTSSISYLEEIKNKRDSYLEDLESLYLVIDKIHKNQK